MDRNNMGTSNKHINTFMILFTVVILLGFIYFFWIHEEPSRNPLSTYKVYGNNEQNHIKLNDYSRSILALDRQDIISVSPPERRTLLAKVAHNESEETLPSKIVSIINVELISKEKNTLGEIKKEMLIYTDHAVAIKDYETIKDLIATKFSQE